MLQFASSMFDASLIEILTVLMVGGWVCVPSDLDRLNNVTEFMNRVDVNTTLLTPSFVNLITPGDFSGLETLIRGDEAMSNTHVDSWADNVNPVNVNGPNETSVVAPIHVDSRPSNAGQRHDKCWIVDARNHDRLCPVGTVGELVVEGPSLERGHLNDAETTSEAFIKNPEWASSQPGLADRILYKTGELVKYSGDSSMDISVVGRKDTQTLARGGRLDLDEVEHNLNVDKAIRNVLVTVPRDGHEAGKLVAVVSLHSVSSSNGVEDELGMLISKDITSKTSSIQVRLSNRLPSYMVPSKWIVLRKIPLLISGEPDRKRVERFVDNLDQQRPQETDPTIKGKSNPKSKNEVEVSPSVNISEELRKSWSHVLKLPIEAIDAGSSFLHLVGCPDRRLFSSLI